MFSIVVAARRNSSEEEFESFKLSIHSDPPKMESFNLEEDLVFTKEKPVVPKRPIVKVDEDDDDASPLLNFSAMAKIGDLKAPLAESTNDEDENETEDLSVFIKTLSRKKFREKYSKVRSEEHSDKEDSSSSTSDEESDVDGEKIKTFFLSHYFLLIYCYKFQHLQNITPKFQS